MNHVEVRAPDPSDLGADLTACDREPIHIPGAIQPHGLLLVVDGSGTVVAGAGELEARLAPDWLGRSLSELLGPVIAERLLTAQDGAVSFAGPFQAVSESFDVSAVRSGESLLVQLEPASDAGLSSIEMLAWIDEVATSFERASDLRAVCERAATAFRDMFGFDRVMIYRFLDDDAGVVIAEDKAPELDSFLNHHFPASDIPKQARALYIRNRVRVIPDVNYVPAPIRPDSAGVTGLDLSDVDLRSVSPIHLQYLKNMGVAASASVSIVRDGVLWGLVACHNREPRTISLASRLAARTLAGGLARQIRAKEEAESYRERIRLRSAEDAAVGRISSELSWSQVFGETSEELRRMMGADGFAALQGKELHLAGRCPARDEVLEIGEWLRASGGVTPFSTDRLPAIFPQARAYPELCSGLLSVTLSTEEPTILMWFRAEHIQVVNWAGNPHKAVEADPNAVLTPRTSFEQWSESVRGRSRPWSLTEVEAAVRLRRSLFEARQNRRIRELNRELTNTLEENRALLGQKDYLLKEVNHRVQNSLQLVSAFLGLQAKAVKDPEFVRHIDEAQRRLTAVALVHRRLYADDKVETVDLARYIEELCEEMKVAMGESWASQLTLDLAPILISADRAVNLGLVLTELVINANKYAYGGESGPLSIGLEQHRNRLMLIVADRGSGKPSGGRQGFGTRMLNAMVERLSGTIEETSNMPGLRVIVTAPIEAA